MLKQIINKALSHYSEERINEMCEFLKEQEITEDNSSDIASCVFVLSKFYQEIPNLKLIFDKNIKIEEKRKILVTFTSEQVIELNMLGVDALEQLKTNGLLELIHQIEEDATGYENFISTDGGNFISISLIGEETYSSKLCITMNCKVLTLKDMRKLKLDNINSK